jgi:methylated-DNA-[protein]-cysteine S-methyltransferase
LDRANFAYPHPRGPLLGLFTDRGLREFELPRSAWGGVPMEPLPDCARDWARELTMALDRYFAGEKEDFTAVPLDLGGSTDFRRLVWITARTVPWGHTSSYGRLAQAMGRGRGVARAVGQALGANPVPIIVPCHRFLASNGCLGGFSGGLDWKRELLRIEGIPVPERQW